jgi:hypothetical protein
MNRFAAGKVAALTALRTGTEPRTWGASKLIRIQCEGENDKLNDG